MAAQDDGTPRRRRIHEKNAKIVALGSSSIELYGRLSCTGDKRRWKRMNM
jgi:hypothetical protein